MKHNIYTPHKEGLDVGTVSGIISIKPDGSSEMVTIENGITKSEIKESAYAKNLHELEKKTRKWHIPQPNEFFSETFEVDNLFQMWERKGIYPTDKTFMSYRKNAKTTFILSYFDRKLKEFRKKYESVFNEEAAKNTHKSEKVVLSGGMAVPASMASAIPPRRADAKVKSIAKGKTKAKVTDRAVIIASKSKIKSIIDNWFYYNNVPSNEMLRIVASRIADREERAYFYQYLAEKRKNRSERIQSATTQKSKKQKKQNKQDRKKNKRPKAQVLSNPPRSGYTDVDYNIQYNHPSRRKPKYGYARDIFGRIQERDHYVEGCDVNPYNSSNSLYDREDDSSSAYDGWD